MKKAYGRDTQIAFNITALDGGVCTRDDEFVMKSLNLMRKWRCFPPF